MAEGPLEPVRVNSMIRWEELWSVPRPRLDRGQCTTFLLIVGPAKVGCVDPLVRPGRGEVHGQTSPKSSGAIRMHDNLSALAPLLLHCLPDVQEVHLVRDLQERLALPGTQVEHRVGSKPSSVADAPVLIYSGLGDHGSHKPADVHGSLPREVPADNP